MQGLPEAQFKWVYTGTQMFLGTDQSRKGITDATWITERSIFAAAQIPLMLTHLQPEHKKTPHKPGIPLNISADPRAQAALRALLPLTVSSGLNRKDKLQHCVTNKAMILCQKGQAKGKVGILILPIWYFPPAKDNPHNPQLNSTGEPPTAHSRYDWADI